MMKLNKREAFVVLLGIWVILPLLYQSMWVFSRTTTATVYAADATRTGRGGVSGRRWISGISMEYAAYDVDHVTYHGSYFRDERDVDNRSVTVRYLIFAPGISRKNSFAGNWGYTIVFIVFFSLITSILFIRKDILADGAIFFVQGKWPLIRIENDPVENYDVLDIDSGKPTDAEQAFKRRLDTEPDLFKSTKINTSVYKFNPNAIAIFLGYLVLFFLFFKILLAEMSVGPGIIFLGAVLVFVPLYVQNTNNPTFKAKIPDEGSLIFSTDGVQYKDELYSIDDLEAAVIYLEAFRGFQYRERTTIGRAITISSGDNNKISCRSKGEIVDFTFILNDFSGYWSFKYLLTNWSARGVNVLLEKVFEDDFVVQEMTRFGTPVSAHLMRRVEIVISGDGKGVAAGRFGKCG